MEKVKTDIGGHAQIFFMSAIVALQLEGALTQLNICNFLKFFLRNSIVFSPTTVHITEGYMLFWSGYKQISKTNICIIEVCQGFPLSLPSLVVLYIRF
jgi:hypothetical protein